MPCQVCIYHKKGLQMTLLRLDPAKKRYRARFIVPAFPRFNIYSRIARKTTALGPVCVATMVSRKPRWDVEVIDENNLYYHPPIASDGGLDHRSLQQDRPADIVGLYGGLTSTIPRLYEVAGFYKQSGAITIAGGQHFAKETIVEALNSGIDFIVIGEGELTIEELIDALQGQRPIESVNGIAYMDNGHVVYTAPRQPISDFDSLPLPDFSLVRYAKIEIYPVERIRGCGMNCEFCTVKGRPRAASVERMLANIRQLVETRGADDFFVVDDLFGQQRDETIRLCNVLARHQERIGTRLCFTVQIRLDKANDIELLEAMRQAGIRYVAIGLESPIDQELQAMNKHIDAAQMTRLIHVFRRYGFIVHGMFIFGYPSTQLLAQQIPLHEKVRIFKRFIRKARIDTIQVLLPVPLPGTQLRQRLVEQNRVYPYDTVGWEYYDGNFPLFEPDPPYTALQIQQAAKQIMQWFYRFRYLFMIGVSAISLPIVTLYLHNIRKGWEDWYRYWRNHLIRFGGWLTIKKWQLLFQKDQFLEKLYRARTQLYKTAGS